MTYSRCELDLHHVPGPEKRDHRPLSRGGPVEETGRERSRDEEQRRRYARAGPRERSAVSRTVGLTVRWPAPPPPHTVALGRAVKVAGLFVSLPRTHASSFSFSSSSSAGYGVVGLSVLRPFFVRRSLRKGSAVRIRTRARILIPFYLINILRLHQRIFWL